MPNPLISITQGWTDALPFRLEADDLPIDLTGLTVQIYLKGADGSVIKDTSSGMTLVSSTDGDIEYLPSTSSGDVFLARYSPYRLRFRVTDAIGRVMYVPNDEEALIEVNLP